MLIYKTANSGVATIRLQNWRLYCREKALRSLGSGCSTVGRTGGSTGVSVWGQYLRKHELVEWRLAVVELKLRNLRNATDCQMELLVVYGLLFETHNSNMSNTFYAEFQNINSTDNSFELYGDINRHRHKAPWGGNNGKRHPRLPP